VKIDQKRAKEMHRLCAEFGLWFHTLDPNKLRYGDVQIWAWKFALAADGELAQLARIEGKSADGTE
jgi:hypothetical protein